MARTRIGNTENGLVMLQQEYRTLRPGRGVGNPARESVALMFFASRASSPRYGAGWVAAFALAAFARAMKPAAWLKEFFPYGVWTRSSPECALLSNKWPRPRAKNSKRS